VLAAAKEAVEWAQEAAKGERGRLVIGSFGALTGVLSRFREQHPLVEITFLQMNNRAQVEAVAMVCPKNRRFPKGTVPELKDFRYDKFLSVEGYVSGYEQWLRDLCKRIGRFEPEIAAVADSPDSLIMMVAAGRGVFVGAEVSIRGRQESWRSAGDIYVLTEPGSIFELFAI
jgi:DNA-binding transcriptional LysR family regulator